MGGNPTVNSLRSATIFLGLIVVGLGFYSFYQSTWYNQTPAKAPKVTIVAGSRSDDGDNQTNPRGREYLVGDAKNPGLYRYCDAKKISGCPDIIREFFYVSVIITCFVLSVGLMIVSIFLELSTNPFKLIDLCYHIAAAVVLGFAAYVYYIDTSAIEAVISEFEKYKLLTGLGTTREEVLITEKYIAVALTGILGIVYAALAKFIVC